MKTFLLSAILALALAGCKTTNPVITKALVQTSVSTGVALGLAKAPDALPYIRASATVVCAASIGTNIAPAQIVADLESSPVATPLKTPQGIIILNGALSLYSVLWEEYGSDVKNMPQLHAWLDGTCQGLQMALPQPVSVPRKLPVHVN